MNEIALTRFVRPRVIDHGSESGEPVRLEDALERRLQEGGRDDLFLEGPPGSGKHTALAYARLAFEGHAGIAFGGTPNEVESHDVRVRLRVDASGAHRAPIERLELAPWKRDEWIEYLLARHRVACTSVMARLEAPELELDLKGRPLLWAAILDEMASDPALPNAFEAMRRAVRRRFSSPHAFDAAARQLWLALSPTLDAVVVQELRAIAAMEPDAAPFLNQGSVHILLGAEHVSATFGEARTCPLPPRLHESFLRAVRPLMHSRAIARETLEQVVDGSLRVEAADVAAVPDAVGDLPVPAEPSPVAGAASLLHLYGPAAVARVLRSLAESGAEAAAAPGAELNGLAAQGLVLCEIQLTRRASRARSSTAPTSRARLTADLRGACCAARSRGGWRTARTLGRRSAAGASTMPPRRGFRRRAPRTRSCAGRSSRARGSPRCSTSRSRGRGPDEANRPGPA